MASKKNEAAPMSGTSIAVSGGQVPALPFDYGADAGKGTREFSQRERGLPFLKILQAQSPEVIGPDGKIAGAQAGMFLNTGTQELYDAVTIVPACRIHTIQEWRMRNAGGGLVGQTVMNEGDDYPQHYKDAMARQEADGRKFGDFWTGEVKKSNQLSECYQLFGVILDAEDTPIGMAVVPFSSTAITVYRKRFSNRISALRGDPPMFAFPITLTTKQLTNDEGTWFNYEIQFPVDNNPVKSALDPKSTAYAAGRKLNELVSTGAVKADQEQDPGQASKAEAADGGSAF